MIPPILPVKFLITNRCNIRCSFCHNEFQGDMIAGQRPLFDLSQTAALLSSLEPTRRFSDLKISGGEPLTFMENVVRVLRIADQFRFLRRILVSNMVGASSRILEHLAASGVGEIRVNVPGFNGEHYAKRTGTHPRTFHKVIRHVERARELNFRVRANIVLSDADLPALEPRLANKEDPFLRLFDEIFLIVDYRCSDGDALEATLLRLATRYGAHKSAERKKRITDFDFDGQKLSIARCDVPTSTHNRDYYVRPPGVLLDSFAAGFAYD
jgi:MoaA/NifB/PqqE/SkfB family radical SAM enzyme